MEKLPEELKEKRKAEIGSCFIGTKKQLDEKSLRLKLRQNSHTVCRNIQDLQSLHKGE